MVEKERKVVTQQELSKHRWKDDLWTVIDNKVYDITEFAKRHPGGNLILSSGGVDATEMYHQYHFEFRRRTDAILNKLPCKGKFEKSSPIIGEFYGECGRRVAEYLKGKPRHPLRAQILYIIDLLSFLGLLSVSWLLDPKVTDMRITFALWFYFFFVASSRITQQGHALGHYMIFGPKLTEFFDHIHTILPIGSYTAFSLTETGNFREAMHLSRKESQSEYYFRGPYEHQAIHHTKGASLEDDGCLAMTKVGGIFRLSDEDEYRWYHKYQNTYVFTTLVWTAMGFIHQTIGHLALKIGNLKRYPPQEFGRIFCCLVSFIPTFLQTRFWILPLLYGTPAAFLIFFVLFNLALHLSLLTTFGEWFFAQHRWEIRLPEDLARKDWGRYNLETTCSFQPTHSLHPFTWFQDGTNGSTLSYHTEHTLFPGMNYLYTKEVAPIIEKCANEFGFEYFKLVGASTLSKYRSSSMEKYSNPTKVKGS